MFVRRGVSIFYFIYIFQLIMIKVVQVRHDHIMHDLCDLRNLVVIFRFA